MATTPQFSAVANIGQCTLTAANTAKDGTGTVGLAFTAGTNGAYVQSMTIRPKGTNAVSVARIFLNNGSDPTVAANNTLIDEVTLFATTNSETVALAGFDRPINRVLPAGYRLHVTLGTTVVGGYAFTVWGGDY